MKHHYSTINGIVTTFSDIHQSAQKGESILVYMERAAENGFDTAEILLPSISFVSYTHKRPLRGHCAPPLQKPSQSVCAFGLTSWGFMVSYSGFSEDERTELLNFVQRNSALIWEIAREDGEVIADVG